MHGSRFFGCVGTKCNDQVIRAKMFAVLQFTGCVIAESNVRYFITASTAETLSKDKNVKASNNTITTEPYLHVSGMFHFGREDIEIGAHLFFSPRMHHCGQSVTKF